MARLGRQQQARGLKVVAILYKGGDAAKQEPRLLGTVENQLGIRQWLESQGHESVVCPHGTRI